MKTSAKGPGKGVRKTGYKLPVARYPVLYGIPYATIANAYNRGWPLDDPEALLRKFEAAPGPKTNLDMLRKIVNGDVLGKPTLFEPDGTLKEETVAALDEIVENDVTQTSMALAGGLMEELARLRKECVLSHRRYIAELRPADKLLRNKEWLANVAALRQLAKEAPKAERDAKNVLLVGDVETTWSRSFKECKTALESLSRRVSTNVLFSKLDPVDVEQVIDKEVTAILAQLESGSWLTNAPGKDKD